MLTEGHISVKVKFLIRHHMETRSLWHDLKLSQMKSRGFRADTSTVYSPGYLVQCFFPYVIFVVLLLARRACVYYVR